MKNHDFAEDAEGSRLKINEWVENQTNKKIRNLQPEGSIDGQTVLLLINAIYFKVYSDFFSFSDFRIQNF